MLRDKLFAFLLTGALVNSGIALAETASNIKPAQRELNSRLDAVIQRLAPPEAHIGVSITRLGNLQPLYEREAKKLFTPASLHKMATAGAALAILGPNQRFGTRVFSNGSLEKNTLYGDIYLRGEGDPTLEKEQLKSLAAQLVKLGIKEINGDLLADSSYFSPEGRGATGWSWDDLENGYAAPVSALSFHRNAVELTITPNNKAGESVRIDWKPRSSYIQLKNRAMTLPAGDMGSLGVGLEPANNTQAWFEVLSVRGGLPAGARGESNELAVHDPVRLTLSEFKDAILKQGIKWRGQTRLAPTPSGARALAQVESPRVADIIIQMLRDSDNLLAETLLLQIGAKERGLPGTWEKGLGELQKYLEKVGWSTGSYRATDGSGLSRYNAVSPAHITQLLNHLPTQRQAYPVFLIGLPTAGMSGTLSQRLNNSPARGRLRAKTGTMSGVSGLAGYLETLSGENYIVTILSNGFVGPAAKMRELQDAIIDTLVKWENGPPSN